MSKEAFSDRLNQALEKAGLAKATQNHLGKLWGVAGATAWNYRNGARTPGIEKASVIARSLGVSVEWLMYGDDVPAGLDYRVLRKIYKGIDAAAHAQKINLSENEVADIAKTVHKLTLESGMEVSDSVFDNIIRLLRANP